MNIKDLTREQLTQVKQSHYCATHEETSWGELAEVDELISDEEIFEAFDGTTFVEDDFS